MIFQKAEWRFFRLVKIRAHSSQFRVHSCKKNADPRKSRPLLTYEKHLVYSIFYQLFISFFSFALFKHFVSIRANSCQFVFIGVSSNYYSSEISGLTFPSGQYFQTPSQI